MKRLPHSGLLVLLALLLFLSGCSARPADGTYLLPSEASSSDAKGTFDLKEVKVQTVDRRRPIGWRGNDLVLYDSAGIYQFNYSTASMTPLLAISDKYLSFAALSGDGKKIAYSEMNAQKRLVSFYLSDADGETNRIDLRNTFGLQWEYFAWSNHGNYLYARTRAASGIVAFDASKNVAVSSKISIKSYMPIYDMDDSSGALLLSRLEGGSAVVYTAGLDMALHTVQTLDAGMPALQASFIGGGKVAVLSGDSTLSISNEEQAGQRQMYANVAAYKVSVDASTICLIKTGASGSYDVYMGNLRDGVITNQTLIYKSIEMIPDSIFFSPDGEKVAIGGYRKETPYWGNSIVVLTFR